MAQFDYTDPWAVQQAQAQASLEQAQQAKQYRAPKDPGMVGRVYVGSHPLESLAELLRTYKAGQMEKEATDKLMGIGQQRQEAQNRDMSAFVQALRGTPAVAPQRIGADIPAFDEADAAVQKANVGGYSGMTGGQAAKAGDPYAAYSLAMTSQSPMVRQMGMQGMAQLPQLEAAKAEKEANRAWQEQQKALDRQAREDNIRLTAKLMAANRPERQAQIIQTEQGPMQLVNGQAVPIMGVGGVPVKGPKTESATEGERKAGTLLQRLRGSQQQLSEAVKEKPDSQTPELFPSMLSGVGLDTAANYATSGNRQRVQSAQLDMLDAALTLGTGAAYTKEQLEGYRKSYFPQLGDTAAQIKDKEVRLKNIIDAAELAAGRVSDKAMPRPPAPKPAGNIDSLLDKYK